jgi:hypothetical protein
MMRQRRVAVKARDGGAPGVEIFFRIPHDSMAGRDDTIFSKLKQSAKTQKHPSSPVSTIWTVKKFYVRQKNADFPLQPGGRKSIVSNLSLRKRSGSGRVIQPERRQERK